MEGSKGKIVMVGEEESMYGASDGGFSFPTFMSVWRSANFAGSAA